MDIFSSLGYKSHYLYYFTAQNFPDLAMRAPSGWVLCLLQISPSSFWEHFLSGIKISPTHLTFSLPDPDAECFSKDVDSFN